jgi:hypothetical protein
VAKTRLKYVKLASDVKKKQALLEATVIKEKADISAELELLEAEQEVPKCQKGCFLFLYVDYLFFTQFW